MIKRTGSQGRATALRRRPLEERGSACPLRPRTSCATWRTSTAGPTARLLTRRARRIGRGDAGIPQPCSPQCGPMRSDISTVTTSCSGLFGARWSFAMAKEPRSWFRLAEVRPLCRGDPAAFEWPVPRVGQPQPLASVAKYTDQATNWPRAASLQPPRRLSSLAAPRSRYVAMRSVRAHIAGWLRCRRNSF